MDILPVACTLNADSLEKRKTGTLKMLFSKVLEKETVSTGYRFRFQASDQLLLDMMDVIVKERHCCKFLNFDLKVPATEETVWLTISGPEGTRAFLEELLDLPTTQAR